MNNSSKNIGGFFELELGSANSPFHPAAIALTSGRSCFNYILQALRPSKIYVPYYLCDSALIPLELLGLQYEFYELDETLKPKKNFSLKSTEYFLYVNYFGLMDDVIDELYLQHGNQLIIDNTQAFFVKQFQDCWSFNSARKFFGVPDGGYLYGAQQVISGIERNQNVGYAHLIERLLGTPSAYQSFLLNESAITADILQISLLSEKLLANIDYVSVAAKRKHNFAVFHAAFAEMNHFKFEITHTAIPFCYPLRLSMPIERDQLSRVGIFIPQFWGDTLLRHKSGFSFEKQFTAELLPLPIDHRYSVDDCLHLIDIIYKHCAVPA